MVIFNRGNVKYFCESSSFFDDLLKVIRGARSRIFIESYKVGGVVGERLRDLLIKKAEEGVEVKLLFDHWGSLVSDDYFRDVVVAGGDVRFFRVFKFATNIFSYNNRRDHRKIAVVDDFCFVGSCNLADNALSWREFVVRIHDSVIANTLCGVFMSNFNVHSFFFHGVKKHLSPLRFSSFEVVRDVPSLRYQKIRNKFLYFIRRAKREIIIETPYFVPDTKMLVALIRAARRGVSVKLVLPLRSDVRLVDVLAQSLFGELHRRGVKIFLFNQGFSHAKVGLFDGEFFSFGSSNFDYRSFRYQYEIAFFGSDSYLCSVVKKHLDVSLGRSCEFDFGVWRRRSLFRRLLEIILEPFRRHF